MATHYSFKQKYNYDVAWKCEHCGKINIQRCQKELEQGYRTSTKYTQKARMEETARFQSEAQGELREQAAKFENEINNGETLLSLHLKGKCSGCGKEQRWKYNKFLEDYGTIATFILSIAAVGVICYFVLHLSVEACLAISLLGGSFLGVFCGGKYLTLYEKNKFKHLNSIKDPEARPLIIGDITKKKILENSDPKLEKDARVIEWKRRREEPGREYEKV